MLFGPLSFGYETVKDAASCGMPFVPVMDPEPVVPEFMLTVNVTEYRVGATMSNCALTSLAPDIVVTNVGFMLPFCHRTNWLPADAAACSVTTVPSRYV